MAVRAAQLDSIAVEDPHLENLTRWCAPAASDYTAITRLFASFSGLIHVENVGCYDGITIAERNFPASS
jgi:hypothetical protein